MRRFFLSRPGLSVVASGAHDADGRAGGAGSFTTAAQAQAHLRAVAGGTVVGAIAFSASSPAALWAPTEISFHPGPLPVSPSAPAPAPGGTVTAARPTPEIHRRRVEEVVARIHRGEAQKVVLARALALRPPAGARFDPDVLVARLAAHDAAGSAFLASVPGGTLVGASPEVLIRRRGRRISCHPLAGSLPRGADPAADQAQARALAASAKDLAEHRFVVEHIRRVLAPLCVELNVPALPQLTSTAELWHLGTQISGTLADPAPSALDLALALHPTPAVCGTPTGAAGRIVAEVEGDRGFYAGAVGWANAAGDGEWLVTIRCAVITDAGDAALVYAGGGLVADSRPEVELAETSAKFRTVLSAFGITEDKV